jgi:hypothetical protein
MKIPIKYGLLITLGVMAWVLITRSLDPQTEQLETVSLKPTKANIAVKVLTLAWAQYWNDKPAWE